MAMAAAREAKAGAGLDQVAGMVRRSVPQTHILFMVDTLKHVVRGERISQTRGLLGSVLGVKPQLTLKGGHLTVSTLARTLAKAVGRLHDFARGYPHAREAAVPYATDRQEAEALAGRHGCSSPRSVGQPRFTAEESNLSLGLSCEVTLPGVSGSLRFL